MTSQTDTMNYGVRTRFIEEVIWRGIEEIEPGTRWGLFRPWYEELDTMLEGGRITADTIYTMLERAYNSGYAIGRQTA